MALKPCQECGREISTEAKVCPHCGKSNPTGVRTSPLAMGCLVLILLSIVGGIVSSINSTSPSVTSSVSGSQSTNTPDVSPQANATGGHWIYSQDEDQMSGKISHAATVLSENTAEFGFPYNGEQHGRLTIRRHPRFGADVIFEIERGQLLCSSYDGCSVLVRFDDGRPIEFGANPPADNSTESIFIRDFERFVTKLRKSKRVRISPKVYQQGTVVFTFDVSAYDPKKLQGK